MASLRILTVCTGNTCRSPMAAALVAARLGAAGHTVEVASVGTLGWSGRPATPHAVEVMRTMGLDITEHRSRRVEPSDLDVDLVLAMTRVHADAIIARDKTLRSIVFLPTELSRLLRTTDTGKHESVTDRLLTLGTARLGPTIGRPAEEVSDPAGEPFETYQATADRLDRAITGVAEGLVSFSVGG